VFGIVKLQMTANDATQAVNEKLYSGRKIMEARAEAEEKLRAEAAVLQSQMEN
jgi:hypothetical protein